MATKFHQPELALPWETIRTDLVKTTLVTIAGLAMQAGLYIYLQHGGWKTVFQLLHSLSL